jgi:hypothetical protein
MTFISYRHHFAYLAVATVVLGLALRVGRPTAMDPSIFIALDGLLYAAALVLALNKPAPFFKRLAFILISAALSGAMPFFGIYLAGFVGFGGLFMAIALASAAGATAYWLLVRAFWVRGLRGLSLVQSAAICVSASLMSLLAASAVTGFGKSPSWVADTFPTVGWWLAFSLSLYLAESDTAPIYRTR